MISSTTNRISYAGAGTVGPFSFPYPVQNLSDLGVALQDTVLGTITPLNYGTDFTTAGVLVANFGYPAGLTVTTSVTIGTGTNLVIFRKALPTQGTSLPETGPLPSRPIEASMDQLALAIQRNSDLSSRGLRLADGYSKPFALTLPSDMFLNPNSSLSVNATGDGIGYGPSIGSLNAAVAAAQAAAATASAQAAAASSSASTSQSYATSIAGAITTKGDLVVGSVSGAASRLPVGTAGQVLTSVGGTATWAAPTGGFTNPMSAAGDIITGGVAGAPQRLAAGTDGQVLTLTGGTPTWAAATGGFTNPMTTLGDLITGGAAGAPGRLGVGANGQVLTVAGGIASWATPAAGGTGTVTSVAATVPTGLAVAGSPITGAGTLAFTWSGLIPQANGGTGLSTAASTGVLKYATGTPTVAPLDLAVDTGATALPLNKGGTGVAAGTANAAFNALSPFTAAGDLLFANALPTAAALPIGSLGKVLTVVGGLPSWQTPSFSSPLTTKGDLLTFDTANARHAVPADYGSLIADPTSADGWRNAAFNDMQGLPGKNLIQYADFENGATTGFSLGTIGTLTNGLPTGTPTFGSGASGNLSIAVSSSSPIDGTKHLNLVSSAATTVGNMLATQAYAVPLSHQAKLVTFSLDFSAISGTANVNWSGTLTNSFALAAWDVTNSVFIPVIGAFAFVQGSGVGNASGSIQTNSNTASIRFIIYNANATAGAVTLAVKNFYAGKQSFVTGAVMTDWVAYSPVYTGFGAVTPIEAFWKQEGDMMLLKGKVTIGTQTAVNAAISLPNGRVIDPNKNTVVEDVGKYEFNNAAFATYHLLASPSTSVLNFGYSNGTQAGLTILQGSQLGITAGAQMSWSASVPIVGWSSNVQMSSDSSAAVVSFVGTAGSGQVLTASVTDVNLTVASDRSGSWSGSQFKVPVSGDYVVGGALSLGVATTAAVYLNGVIVTNGYFGTSNSSGQQSGGSILVPNCKAGDLLSVRSAVSGTVSTSSINIFRISGNNAVAQVESVRARYSTAGGNTIGTGATTLAFATKTYDSHGAYNTSTGLYTCPTSGEYQAYAYIQPTTAIPGTGSYLNVNLYKNGSSYSELYTVYGNGAVANRVGGTDKVICNAGDTLSISANAGTANTTNGLSYIWFARTGN